MCFKSKLEPAKPLHRDLKILKMRDLLTIINCQFAQAHMTGNLPQNLSVKYVHLNEKASFLL